MQQEEIENLTEEQIESIYIYLAAFWEELIDEEKTMWINILEKFDKEFNNIEDE